jgi:hypothetical protein
MSEKDLQILDINSDTPDQKPVMHRASLHRCRS